MKAATAHARLRMPVFVLVSIAALAGCVRRSTTNFDIRGRATQSFAVAAGASVVVQCHCRQHRTTTQGARSGTVTLSFVGDYSSVGYHGDQKVPKVIPGEMMQFARNERDGAILLQSHEFTYIHHAFFLTELEIVAPADIDISFESVDGEALEGRRIP